MPCEISQRCNKRAIRQFLPQLRFLSSVFKQMGVFKNLVLTVLKSNHLHVWTGATGVTVYLCFQSLQPIQSSEVHLMLTSKQHHYLRWSLRWLKKHLKFHYSQVTTIFWLVRSYNKTLCFY